MTGWMRGRLTALASNPVMEITEFFAVAAAAAAASSSFPFLVVVVVADFVAAVAAAAAVAIPAAPESESFARASIDRTFPSPFAAAFVSPSPFLSSSSRILNTSALSGTSGAAHSRKYARSRRRLVQSMRVVSWAPRTYGPQEESTHAHARGHAGTRCVRMTR